MVRINMRLREYNWLQCKKSNLRYALEKQGVAASDPLRLYCKISLLCSWPERCLAAHAVGHVMGVRLWDELGSFGSACIGPWLVLADAFSVDADSGSADATSRW
jgi:hypothetical protein